MKPPKIVMTPIEELIPYVKNVKRHPPKQIDALAGQIHEFGFDQPIVVDKDFVIIKGHGRLEAARKLNLKEVPVIVADHLDEYQVKAARLADNVLPTYGEVDTDLLKFELGSLQLRDFNLKLTGFELKAIETILNTPLDEDSRADKKERKGKDKDTQDAEASTQFIVTVHCADEGEMQSLYDEMISRGMTCRPIT